MVFDEKILKPTYGDNIVAFHVTDMDWDRTDNYLFDHVVRALRMLQKSE